MIDWIAAGFELTGSYTVGNKKRIGFLLLAVGDVVWISVGLMAGLYGLVTIAALALVLNVRNWRKWRKEGAK